MALKPRVDRIESEEFFQREKATFSKYRIERYSRVTLRENKPITILPVWVGWIDLECMEVKRNQHVCTRERPADVPALGVMYRHDDIASDSSGNGMQLSDTLLR